MVIQGYWKRTWKLLQYIGLIQGYWKKHGNYHSAFGFHRDTGKEHGNYYSIWGYIGILEKNMETAIAYSGL